MPLIFLFSTQVMETFKPTLTSNCLLPVAPWQELSWSVAVLGSWIVCGAKLLLRHSLGRNYCSSLLQGNFIMVSQKKKRTAANLVLITERDEFTYSQPDDL